MSIFSEKPALTSTNILRVVRYNACYYAKSGKGRTGMEGKNQETGLKERAVRAAESYQELARVFSSYAEGIKEDKEERYKVCAHVAEYVCAECPKHGHCWEDRKEECQDAFSYIAEISDRCGELEHAVLPEYFQVNCIATKRLVEDWNRSAYMERMKKSAYRQIMEGKEALVHQLQETAKCFLRISEEKETQGSFPADKEKELRAWLRKYHIRAGEIAFLEKKGKGREWRLALRCDARKRISVRLAERLLSEWLGVPVKETLQYSRMLSEEEQTMIFREEPGYQVMTGVARSVKKEQEMSGDSFSFFYEEDGEMTMILSDGMGSGETAAKESEEVLGILERMMAAGFCEETAIRLINSVLALRAEQKNFATLDISRVNLYSGTCEFIKIGGASTYIKRGRWLESVSARTLPVGMVQHLDYDSVVKKLYDGDIIIMVSDGVLEVVPEKERERFLQTVIGEDADQKPQVIAGRILNASLVLQNYEPKDDMTVLVCGVYLQKSR